MIISTLRGWKDGSMAVSLQNRVAFQIHQSHHDALVWFPLLNSNRWALQANQKPWSEIPKNWGLLEQNSYTAFTRSFSSRPNIKEEKRSGYARLTNNCIVLLHIRQWHLHLMVRFTHLSATARMKMRRREHMRNISKMSSMAHLHHSFFLWVVVWVQSPQLFFITVWLLFLNKDPTIL